MIILENNVTLLLKKKKQLIIYYNINQQTSGAIQYGVPMNDLRLFIVAVIWAETPKSANLTSPPSVNNILAP